MLSKVQWSLCEPVSKIQGDTQNYSSMMEKDSQTENDNISLNIVLNIADGDPLRYIRLTTESTIILSIAEKNSVWSNSYNFNDVFLTIGNISLSTMSLTCLKITEEDYTDLTISVFRIPTRERLSCMLNSKKILPSSEKLPRDWRGLCTLLNYTIPLGCDPIDPIGKIFKFCEVKSTIANFLKCLERIDRYDVIEETNELIRSDIIYFKEKQYSIAHPETVIHLNDFNLDFANTILTLDDEYASKHGLPFPKYDAFLLYDDADIHLAETVIDKLEIEYKLKLCLKERDLKPGIMFEYQSMVRLISSDRCKWLIIIVSNNFLNSPWNKFIMNYAQSLAVGQISKIIPCVFSDCILPQELKWFAYIFFNKKNRVYDPWNKLRITISSNINNKILTNFIENNNYQKLKLKKIDE